jgi:hypothetical protein
MNPNPFTPGTQAHEARERALRLTPGLAERPMRGHFVTMALASGTPVENVRKAVRLIAGVATTPEEEHAAGGFRAILTAEARERFVATSEAVLAAFEAD